ncbi:hypothetical protein TW81_15860 [Vibrio galatheae]|uniref:Uncharacterized protein n=1 Tax=Vibrio galatheae TaxID=579748 RepID=A0A0F4NG39_9VIBR|nr:hypothetical protein TW81_15860 [Vibrio galatheae]
MYALLGEVLSEICNYLYILDNYIKFHSWKYFIFCGLNQRNFNLQCKKVIVYTVNSRNEGFNNAVLFTV